MHVLGEESFSEDGYIESPATMEIRPEPSFLPKEFEWSILDLNDPTQTPPPQVKEVYDLLSRNYVESKEADFRALKPPGYHKDWHLGVRVLSNKKLVAFISGVPVKLQVRQNQLQAAEINFLCVHKKLRSKRLAPVLIKEITRRVALKGVFGAIYTAGVTIPTPVAVCRYHTRLLNVPKLVDVKFTVVPRGMTVARMIRINQVSNVYTLPGLREMEARDVISVADLFTRYMRRFELSVLFSVEEVEHHLLRGIGTGAVGDGGAGKKLGQVVWTYVVEDPATHKITDFFSFFSLPLTVDNNAKYSVVNDAYLYYYATEAAFVHGAEENGQLKLRLKALIGDALVVAKQANFDVVHALTIMDNMTILNDLKFNEGNGRLNYYLYNWRTAVLSGMQSGGGVAPGKELGVIMF
ncbi:hypothetical protein H0H92_012112 [Tricholoma furcatifolium]|nr:hypothetical protein H0H92_012112 [Tricholoma furcatifolium]